METNQQQQSNNNCKVSEFLTTNKERDIEKLRSTIGPQMERTISTIQVPSNDIEDEMCWGLTGDGIFSIKSVTWLAQGIQPDDKPTIDAQWIWKLDVAHKIKIFMWQLTHNALPPKGNLMRRGMQLDPICSIFKTEIENDSYLFRYCIGA